MMTKKHAVSLDHITNYVQLTTTSIPYTYYLKKLSGGEK